MWSKPSFPHQGRGKQMAAPLSPHLSPSIARIFAKVPPPVIHSEVLEEKVSPAKDEDDVVDTN